MVRIVRSIFLIQTLSPFRFLLFTCSVPNQQIEEKGKSIGSAKKKKKSENLKTLFILCPVTFLPPFLLYNNKLFRSYPIPSLQQQWIQKVSMLIFFFFLFSFSYSTIISNCIKLPENPFSSAECNFLGLFFYPYSKIYGFSSLYKYIPSSQLISSSSSIFFSNHSLLIPCAREIHWVFRKKNLTIKV